MVLTEIIFGAAGLVGLLFLFIWTLAVREVPYQGRSQASTLEVEQGRNDTERLSGWG